MATISERFADVSRIVHDKCLLCEVLRNLAGEYNTRSTHVESAESETGKRVGKNYLVSALVYCLC